MQTQTVQKPSRTSVAAAARGGRSALTQLRRTVKLREVQPLFRRLDKALDTLEAEAAVH
jgi:hypothetical protein